MEQATQLEAAAAESTVARKMVKNDVVTSANNSTSAIYDDGVTPYHVFNHPSPKERREQ